MYTAVIAILFRLAPEAKDTYVGHVWRYIALAFSFLQESLFARLFLNDATYCVRTFAVPTTNTAGRSQF